jgi:hypothetical protein
MPARLLSCSLLFLLAGCTVPLGGPPPGDSGPTTPPDAVSACEDDDDCEERSLCRGGLCADVGPGCVRKSECGAGLVCVEGACASPPATCSSSEECPGARLCDGFSKSCFDPNGTGCSSSGDCALEPGCAQGCACLGSGACEPLPPTGTDAGPAPVGEPLELGGFVVENREHSPPTQVGVLPAGTRLTPGQRLIIARNAARGAFESFWGVSLGSDVVFLNAEVGNSGVPIVNGGESWALVSPLGTVVDGPTMAGQSGTAYRRINGGAASAAGTWSDAPAEDAAPGAASPPALGPGLQVSQWSDATGSGSFIYEFVELVYAP